MGSYHAATWMQIKNRIHGTLFLWEAAQLEFQAYPVFSVLSSVLGSQDLQELNLVRMAQFLPLGIFLPNGQRLFLTLAVVLAELLRRLPRGGRAH